jgi:hypothetical protein
MERVRGQINVIEKMGAGKPLWQGEIHGFPPIMLFIDRFLS